jgi:hypothetical protein
MFLWAKQHQHNDEGHVITMLFGGGLLGCSNLHMTMDDYQVVCS